MTTCDQNIFKNLKIHNKETTTKIGKRHGHFSRGYKHIKRCSTSPTIKEM